MHAEDVAKHIPTDYIYIATWVRKTTISVVK